MLMLGVWGMPTRKIDALRLNLRPIQITYSISGQLSEKFQLTAITLRKTIAPTSNFHHQIVANWKPKFIFIA